MNQFLQRLPLLLVAFVFLVIASTKTTDVTQALLSAGLVVLGAWVSVEVVRLWETQAKEEVEVLKSDLTKEEQ